MALSRTMTKHNTQDAISETVREVIAEWLGTRAEYRDAAGSADYLGISLRTFEGEPAKEIPCHRLTPGGKRLYKRADLEAYMEQHRQAPPQRGEST